MLHRLPLPARPAPLVALCLCLGLLLSACATAPQIRDRRVMVMNFDAPLNIPNAYALGSSLSAFLSAELVNYPRIAIIERADLKHESSRDPLRYIDIGNKAGVDYLVLGTLSKLEQNYVINTRLFSVSTGQIVTGSSVTRAARREEDLYPTIQAMSRELAGHLKTLAERYDAQAAAAQ